MCDLELFSKIRSHIVRVFNDIRIIIIIIMHGYHNIFDGEKV